MSIRPSEDYEARAEVFKTFLRDCAYEELKTNCVHVLSEAITLHDSIVRKSEGRSWRIYEMIWRLQLSLETCRRAIFDHDVSEREERLVRAAIKKNHEWMEKNYPAKAPAGSKRKAAPRTGRGAAKQ